MPGTEARDVSERTIDRTPMAHPDAVPLDGDVPAEDVALLSALRSLPRPVASPGFTDRVLRRLDAPEHPTERHGGSLPWRGGWPLLVAALLLLVVGVRELWHRQQLYAATERIATLRVEQRELQREIDDLRHLTAEARPVVYLGSEDGVDFVFDLSRLRQGDRVVIPDYLHPILGAQGGAQTAGRSGGPRAAIAGGAQPLDPGAQPAVFKPRPTY